MPQTRELTTTPQPGAICSPRLAALYPIAPDRECDAIVQSVWLGERDADGAALLRGKLTAPQERHLRERSALLRKTLEPAAHAKIKAAVSRMLLGFNRAADETTAAATVAQFITVLQSLPLWAIERTCARFAGGHVGSDEVEGLNRAFPPTTAQVFAVAERLVAEYRAEAMKVHAVLRGRLAFHVSDEDRRRVAEGLAALSRELAARHEQRVAEERAKVPAERWPRRERRQLRVGEAIAAAMGRPLAPEPTARELEELEP